MQYDAVSRESLYKALSGERAPSFGTILRVVAAQGLRFHAEPAHIENHAKHGCPNRCSFLARLSVEA
jgi:hypothetical protein